MWLLGKHLVSDRNFSTSERWMTPLGGSQNPQLFRVSFYTENTSGWDLKEPPANTDPGKHDCRLAKKMMRHLRDDVAQPLGVNKVKVLELKCGVIKVQQNSCRKNKQMRIQPPLLRTGSELNVPGTEVQEVRQNCEQREKQLVEVLTGLAEEVDGVGQLRLLQLQLVLLDELKHLAVPEDGEFRGDPGPLLQKLPFQLHVAVRDQLTHHGLTLDLGKRDGVDPGQRAGNGAPSFFLP